MTAFLGHFHPLLVHLPIGMLLLAFVLECMMRFQRRVELQLAIDWAIRLGTAAAIASAGSGWLLATEGGFEADLLQQHRYWGIGTVLIFLLLIGLRRQKLYFPVFVAGIIALSITGHLGGSLTHGTDYLAWDKAETGSSIAPVVATLDETTPIFAALIQPILQDKCVSCHRPEKRKGNLDFTTKEAMLIGGKHGPVFVAGNADSSHMMQRMLLPMHLDEHMPPSGKKQLEPAEIETIMWWINNGASFEANLKMQPLPPALEAQWKQQREEAPTSPVFARKIDAPNAAAVQQLLALHADIQPLAAQSPWLKVSFAGQKTLTDAHWQVLKKVREQVVDLDVSHSNVADNDLKTITFPHLIRLNVAHTAVGKALPELLQASPYLEVLNATGSSADDAIQSVLPTLLHLKKVFLWQSGVSESTLKTLQQQLPKVRFETGNAPVDDAMLALRSPKMLYGRSFFDDTMHVELSFPFKGVSIYYTIDEAASPTTQSPVYREKIVLDKTGHVRAFAAKDGWQNSPLIDAMFVRKKYTIKNATLLTTPSPKYPAKGGVSLIDGKISDAQGPDSWLGYEGEHLDAVLDLGLVKDVTQVFVHCLENNGPWIHRPVGIQVSTSTDGKKYTPGGTQKFPPNTSMGEQKAHLLGCKLNTPVHARYLKVRVESLLKNPVWHPGKGQKCWIFVDEMTVE
jgi:uncharacterized membrane protein/mono/diheme cytochrome c family protein